MTVQTIMAPEGTHNSKESEFGNIANKHLVTSHRDCLTTPNESKVIPSVEVHVSVFSYTVASYKLCGACKLSKICGSEDGTLTAIPGVP